MPDPDLVEGVDTGGEEVGYEIPDYYYEVPDYDFGLYYGADDVVSGGDSVKEDDLNMYWDELKTTTTLQPPDVYDYLFGFDIPNRNRIKVPTRKKFDAQALKRAYTEMLKNANELQSKRKRRLKRQIDVIGAISKYFFSSKQNEDTIVSEQTISSRQNDVAHWVQDKVVDKIGGSIYSVINETIKVPRDSANSLYRGRPLPKVVGLLLRTPPSLFRTSFVKISLGTFSIVSTGTLGKLISYLYKVKIFEKSI